MFRLIAAKKYIWIHLASGLSILSLAGCTLSSPQQSKVSIVIPDLRTSQSSSLASHNQANHLLPGDSANASFLAPNSLSEFSCFGINVIGEGIAPAAAVVHGDVACDAGIYFGTFGGFVPVSGGVIEVTVPSGKGHTVQLFGSVSTGGCPDILGVMKNGPPAYLDEPYELGRSVVDVFDDTTVTIVAGYNPGNPKKVFCSNPASIPSGLSYDLSSALYPTGSAISPNYPHLSHGAATLYAVSPSLPAGLSLDSSTGRISGTPSSVTQATNYTITASSSAGSTSTSLNIEIVEAVPAIAYGGPYVFTQSSAISPVSPSSSGGSISSCSISPALPSGLSFNGSTCQITGTPIVISGAVLYTVIPSNATGVGASAGVTITVQEPLPAIGYSGSPFSFTAGIAVGTITPTNGGGSITGCSSLPPLPSGLSLSTACVISGTTTSSLGSTTYSITASNSTGSATPVSINIAVISAAPSVLLISGSSAFTAGDCQPFTIMSKDSYGNISNVGGGETIGLSSDGNGLFYGTGACSGSIAATTIDAGMSSKTVYFQNTLAEASTLTASRAAWTSGTQSVTVSAGPAADLYLASGPGTATGGVCTTAYNVQLRDSFGNLATSGSNVTFTPYLSGGSGSFHPDPSCTSSASLTILAGFSSANLYFRASGGTSGTLVLNSNDGGLINNGSIPVTLKTVTKIARGEFHVCALMSDQTVQCWGDNFYGQSGAVSGINCSSQACNPSPTAISGLTNVIDIAAGGYHTCAVDSIGSIYCWGQNNVGQLGDGTTVNSSTPVAVSGVSAASQVTAGYDFTCAKENSGLAKCWGGNQYGQLGTGVNTPTYSSTAQSVGVLSAVTSISSGYSHTCAIEGGGLKCWGRNHLGQLGLGNLTNSYSPLAISTGDLFSEISAGYYQSCAIRTDGRLFCWGDNTFSQLSVGTSGCGATCSMSPAQATTDGTTPLESVLSVSVGYRHTCVSTTAQTGYCFGESNVLYPAALGNGSYSATPYANSTIKDPSGSATLTDITQVLAGNAFGCSLASGGVACWGYNIHGTFGTGDYNGASSRPYASFITGF